MDDSNKYNHMENVLQHINKHYVSLDKDQVKINNRIKNELLTLLTDQMKELNPLFKKLYTTIYYGGSYFDGLKITDPGEYDCDLLLVLPAYAKPVIELAPIPGFVQVKLIDWEKFTNQPEYKVYYQTMKKDLLDDDIYVRTDKLIRWMESILDKVLNNLLKLDNFCHFSVGDKSYQFKKTKGGPAFTVHITDPSDEKFFMDMDLVPCFKFQDTQWPSHEHFRKNPTATTSFFVVPKNPQGSKNCERYWRLSFQEQEAEIIGHRQSLKPALKLLKKLRDKYIHSAISSYFIKTIFLWEVNKGEETFWKQNLSAVFMKMLQTYHDYLTKRTIPYFWDERFNLIKNVKENELVNISNKVGKILKEMERNIDDPFVIATHLVPKQDLEQLKNTVVIGKKHDKRSVDVVDGFSKITDRSISICQPMINNSVACAPSSDKLESLENSVREVNSKIDLILSEQRAMRLLLERISGGQTGYDIELRPHNDLTQSNLDPLLPGPYDLLQASLKRMQLDDTL